MVSMDVKAHKVQWTLVLGGPKRSVDLLPGANPKVSVTLENEVHEQKYVFVEDEWLIENHLDEGSVWSEEC